MICILVFVLRCTLYFFWTFRLSLENLYVLNLSCHSEEVSATILEAPSPLTGGGMVSPPPDYTANITISFTAFRTLKTKLFSTWLFTTKHEVALSHYIYIKAGSVSWWRLIFSHNAILCSVRNPCYLEKWSVRHSNLGQARYFIYLSSLMISWFSKQGVTAGEMKDAIFLYFPYFEKPCEFMKND